MQIEMRGIDKSFGGNAVLKSAGKSDRSHVVL